MLWISHAFISLLFPALTPVILNIYILHPIYFIAFEGLKKE
jgi:hypothetical protein